MEKEKRGNSFIRKFRVKLNESIAGSLLRLLIAQVACVGWRNKRKQ